MLIIALVLFPLTWIVNAFLIGSWNLLGDRNAESWRHLREAAVVFVCTVCIVFLMGLLPSIAAIFKMDFQLADNSALPDHPRLGSDDHRIVLRRRKLARKPRVEKI